MQLSTVFEKHSAGSGPITASLHRKRLAHDGVGVGEICLRGVFD